MPKKNTAEELTEALSRLKHDEASKIAELYDRILAISEPAERRYREATEAVHSMNGFATTTNRW